MYVNIHDGPVLFYSWSHFWLESSPELCTRALGDSGKITPHVALGSIYSFMFLLKFNLLSCSLHAVKFTNLLCIAQWILTYTCICVTTTLIKTENVSSTHEASSCLFLVKCTKGQLHNTELEVQMKMYGPLFKIY